MCGKKIIVRQGKPVTEEEATIIDWIKRLQLSENEFKDERKELSNKLGFLAPVNDTIWAILNKRVQSKDNFDRKIAYYEMARLMGIEGKNSKPYIIEALKIDLQEIKERGYKKVKMLGCGNRCDDYSMCESCRKLCGTIIGIDDALESMPIPNQCTNSQCRCTYEEVNESSIKDRLSKLPSFRLL
jgi:hypothetical protein